MTPFNVIHAVKDREELLEEIMRRGSSSLGTDVPSEREINRLAARTEEEFWLFEKIDEERRKKESYRTRLMEEQEVPDWVYATPDPNDKKGKGFDYEAANITGKRRRKEVIYQDTYNDELIKELENGESSSRSMKGKKKKENPPPVVNNEVPNEDSAGEEKAVQGSKKEAESVVGKGTRGHTIGFTLRKVKADDDASSSHKEDDSSQRDATLDGLTWKAHKRKRSSLVS